MPRSSIDISMHYEHIVRLWEEDYSISDILQNLNDERDVQIGRTALKRRLTEWNLQRRVRLEDTPALRTRIIALTYESCFNDKDTYEVLCRKGYVLGMRAFVRLRKSMNIYKRVSVFNREESDAELTRVVEQEFAKGNIDSYSRSLLYYHFRTRGNLVSRYTPVRAVFHISLLI